MPEEPSIEELLEEIENLRLEVDTLKREKADLEILLDTTTAHADSIVEMLHAMSLQLHESNKKLQAEIAERQRTETALRSSQSELESLLAIVSRDKADLEIMLETTIQHGDLIEELLHNQCIRDPLTGLFNRRFVGNFLERELNRSLREQQALGVIMFDIDHFKRFNDTFGHDAGDVVLAEVGRFLQHSISNSDIACRYGGEEFMLILPETDWENTEQRAEQLRDGIKHLKLQYMHQPLGGITVSLGVACFPEHGTSGAELIQVADLALYRAKALGRDRVVTAKCLKDLQQLIPSLPLELEQKFPF
ncbi:GGDEF domain-containing protein [Microseira wollei]|uniref:Diguanylate cyclase n=1 Tax=Microseira wollei NIES-4236 TaxID=2530354 RepID=A0AAV3XB90_9CYAN|nr:GGDEF domain-containing protein [Microseira wollei]GET39743.1 putative diguanylate cyclase [Microseira wollei NIES-4236]